MRAATKHILINIGIVALMGVVAFAIIDNAAHFGGLVGGTIAGILLVPRGEQQLPLGTNLLVKTLGSLALAGIVIFGLLTATEIGIGRH